jgi:hypothetical protein
MAANDFAELRFSEQALVAKGLPLTSRQHVARLNNATFSRD